MESHLPSTIDSKCPEPQASSTDLDRDAKFLAMLPKIRRQAAYYLRRLPTEKRAEAIEEVVANTFVSYVRLIERGKADLAFAGPLARYAVCQYLQWPPGRQQHECATTSPRITADGRKGCQSNGSISSTTRLMNGRNLWWKISIRAQLTLRQHESTFVRGSIRCPSGRGMWPKRSPRAKRQAMLHGCSIVRRRGSASFAESCTRPGRAFRGKGSWRHRSLRHSQE